MRQARQEKYHRASGETVHENLWFGAFLLNPNSRGLQSWSSQSRAQLACVRVCALRPRQPSSVRRHSQPLRHSLGLLIGFRCAIVCDRPGPRSQSRHTVCPLPNTPHRNRTPRTPVVQQGSWNPAHDFVMTGASGSWWFQRKTTAGSSTPLHCAQGRSESPRSIALLPGPGSGCIGDSSKRATADLSTPLRCAQDDNVSVGQVLRQGEC